MNQREFHNLLRVMISIDRDELVTFGVMQANDTDGWRAFSDGPYRWFIKAPDAQADNLWRLLESRTTR